MGSIHDHPLHPRPIEHDIWQTRRPDDGGQRRHVPDAPPAGPDPRGCVPSHRRMPGGGYPRREPVHGRAASQPSRVDPTQIEHLPSKGFR